MIPTINDRIANDWLLAESAPNAIGCPKDLGTQNLRWVNAIVPGTAAQAYAKAGLWSINEPFDFDSKDWWYKTQFHYSDKESSPSLNFKGLATLSEVWLNDQLILSSNNMFISHDIDASKWLKKENTLIICFRSVKEHLLQKRPRPRWKTKLVEHQQLRWLRTSLLGRIPGWTPPVTAVGPWQAISLQRKSVPVNIELSTVINQQSGVLTFSCQLLNTDKNKLEASLSIEDTCIQLTTTPTDTGVTLSGTLEIQNVTPWWPHTHGKPKLYTPQLVVSINNEKNNYALDPIGFKEVQVDQTNNHFKFIVNNKPIFCRGACWTVNDIISLNGESSDLEQTLTLMRDAGANMIRIGGTMLYEQDHFYALCDKLGIMVWQDFMFANMDYPIEDADFKQSVNTEITQIIIRLRKFACISMYCGNSEIEQQTSMLGLDKNECNNTLFSALIPSLCAKHSAGIPYITSTPTGEIMPFHTNKDVAHYYGIGAYQRPVSELRQHDVKFTSECLGFSNIPISQTRNKVLNGQLPVTHNPIWKQRVPRDTGTGWDFEDIRDYYTRILFNIDPITTRSYDTERYLALSEVTTGEIMSQTFSEWRSNHSDCSGGLVWFLKDLWRGAGWGIIDSDGSPKACYYYLKRCWQPINIGITNETLNGLDIHINNESSQAINGKIEICLLNKNSVTLASNSTDIHIASQEIKTINSDTLLKHFYDTTYSYRFGPSKHSIVAVQLKNDNSELISEAFYFPNSEEPYSDSKSILKATATQIDSTTYTLEISCNCFLYAVCIEADGYDILDNFFHLLPNTVKHVTLKQVSQNTKRFKGYVSAINITDDVKIKVIKQ